MKNFHAACHGAKFEIHEGNTYTLIELLTKGLIEVGIVRTPFRNALFHCKYLEEEPMIATMTAEHDWDAAQTTISLTALENRPLILYRRFEQLILEACSEQGFTPDIFCKNDDARTSVIWADAGLGISILPASAFGLVKNPDTVSRQISDLPLTSSICLVRSQDTWISTAAHAFLNCLSETYDHPFT